ncbi:unnamed protein product [Didymodactylos carnosus]|uniref:Myeloid leukemia factor n=1 Tax=Didymodactylos carnosus TaxID=1234261 RepID=A0A815G1W5_9BILA|nr:unnamed protein product [Didymodactylos carnosus]CAF1333177.1 unnamed protein product [Didymodactylos carnosus]CAF3717253.1 unnamed protein product [Didymodactylos carnosus]CAF4188672.1 unnamed protein product [Didymodactylos carnosus]
MSLFSSFRNDPFFAGIDMPFGDFDRHHALPSSSSHRAQDFRSSDTRLNRNLDLMLRDNGENDLFSNPLSVMQRMMGNTQNMMANIETRMSDSQMGSNGVSFSSSTMYSMDNRSGNGQPRIFQATSEKLRGPEGLERTRKAVRDTGRNLEKMEISHRIGERGHRVLRERDPSTGQLIENKEFEHIDPNNESLFQDEWNKKTQNIGNLNNALFNARIDYTPIGDRNRAESMDRGGSRLAIRQPLYNTKKNTTKKSSKHKHHTKK